MNRRMILAVAAVSAAQLQVTYADAQGRWTKNGYTVEQRGISTALTRAYTVCRLMRPGAATYGADSKFISSGDSGSGKLIASASSDPTAPWTTMSSGSWGQLNAASCRGSTGVVATLEPQAEGNPVQWRIGMRSTDGGSSWAVLRSGRQMRIAGMDTATVNLPDGTAQRWAWIVEKTTGANGILYSPNIMTSDAPSWIPVALTGAPNTSDMKAITMRNSALGFAVGGNLILRTTNGTQNGGTWNAYNWGADAPNVSMANFVAVTWITGTRSEFLAVSRDGQIAKTTNGGDSWSLSRIKYNKTNPAKTTCGAGEDCINPTLLGTAFVAGQPSRGWIVGEVVLTLNSPSGMIWGTSDGGATWTVEVSPADNVPSLWAISATGTSNWDWTVRAVGSGVPGAYPMWTNTLMSLSSK